MDAADPGGRSNDLPWARVFDSAANIRALSAIQADGLRAASELVERFVRMAAVGLNGYGQPARPGATGVDEQPSDLFGATGFEPFVASWWSMVDQFLAMSSARVEQPAAAAGPTLDLSAGLASGHLRLVVSSAGAATGEVWLYNGATTDLGKVGLRCSDLLAHDGTLVSSDRVRCEPDVVPMPARSSRGVTVEISVSEATVAATYRGMLLADGHPDLWLPVELVVEPAP